MTIQEMKRRKQEWGYTYFQIAELSGVPIETVKKIFEGNAENIDYRTWSDLENAFRETQKEMKLIYPETARIS